MLNRRHEKIIYENDRGHSVTIRYALPYWLNQVIGLDGSNAMISSSRSVNQDGVTINNVSLPERQIQILGEIKGASKDNLSLYRSQLLQAFNPKVMGTLYYEYGYTKRKIRVQVGAAPSFAKSQGVYNVLSFIVDLVAPDPYLREYEDSDYILGTYEKGMTFPLTIPEGGIYISNTDLYQTVNAVNAGDESCGIEVVFKALGEVVNPRLTNDDTGEFIQVNQTLQLGDVLTVTTHFLNKRAILNQGGVETNVFNWIDLDSTFLQLAVGDNNLSFDAYAGLDNLEITIKYTPRYLGV